MPAHAESRAGMAATMAVSVEILPNCTVATGPLMFGSAQNGTGATATSQIAVNCGPSVPFTMQLDRGRQPDARGRRALDAASGRYLSYGIYRDAAYQSAWSDTADGSASGTTDSSGQFHLTAYGRIEPGQATVAGTYADAVVVTVQF